MIDLGAMPIPRHHALTRRKPVGPTNQPALPTRGPAHSPSSVASTAPSARATRGRRAIVVVVCLAAVACASLESPVPALAATTSWHVPVLMFHHVRPPSKLPDGERYPDLYLNPALLDAQLAALKSWGWRSITARDLATAIKRGVGVPPRTIVLTFDDGARDNYRYAYPILEKHGFKATFYMIAGKIGYPGKMTGDQLRDLVEHGHEVGNHTWAHVPLATVSYSTARSQIRRASDRIAAVTGIRPTTLAYPYGSYDSTAMSAAMAEGIDLAFTTESGASESWSTRLREQRIRIHGYRQRSDGTYGGGTTASQLLRTLARHEGPLATAPVARLYAGVTMTGGAPVLIRWSAKDPTGVRSYRLLRSTRGGDYRLVTTTSRAVTRLRQVLAFGSTYRYAIRATNNVGATSRRVPGPAFRPRLVQEDGGALAYAGTWSRAASAAWSGGAAMTTTEAEASVTYAFTGLSVAWLADLGPRNGSADIYIDGALASTISLYAPSPVARRVVFARSWSEYGSHEIRIVNVGTEGHDRIGCDAFLVLRVP
jgi:peptidoglycan/xylan/chitin deacetylase (PgdA/CDA1 family)